MITAEFDTTNYAFNSLYCILARKFDETTAISKAILSILYIVFLLATSPNSLESSKLSILYIVFLPHSRLVQHHNKVPFNSLYCILADVVNMAQTFVETLSILYIVFQYLHLSLASTRLT